MVNSISLTLYADVCYRGAEMLGFSFRPVPVILDYSHFVIPISQRNDSPFFSRVGHDCVGSLIKLQHISPSEICFRSVLFLTHYMCDWALSLLGVITLKQYECRLKKCLMGRVENCWLRWQYDCAFTLLKGCMLCSTSWTKWFLGGFRPLA